MTILKIIGLSKRYGKAIYAISAVLTLAISSLVFFNPYAIPMAILLPQRLAKWVHFRLFSAFSAITSNLEMFHLSPYNKLTEIP